MSPPMKAPKAKSKKKPLVIRMTKEKLAECRGMSPEEKLRWLEEANLFVAKLVSPEKLSRWRNIQEGT